MNIPTWLMSSANPKNISLLVRSLATFAVLFGADATVVTQIDNDLVSLIAKVLEVVALGYAVWGGGRKIILGRWTHPNV